MRAARWPLVGVVAAVLVLVGGAWYQAVVTPAYFSADEPGHVGYLLAIQDGDLLPEIDDDIPLDGGGPELAARLAATSESRRHMYVAKSPPWPYVMAAGARRAQPGPRPARRRPLRAAGDEPARRGGGRRRPPTPSAGSSSGGDRRVGLVAAGTLAALPYVGLRRRARDDRRDRAGGHHRHARDPRPPLPTRPRAGDRDRRSASRRPPGAGIRAMSLVECAVACAIALGIVLWRRTVPVVWAALWLAVPAALMSGWYYVLNRVRYGDVTATDYLGLDPRPPAGRLAGARPHRRPHVAGHDPRPGAAARQHGRAGRAPVVAVGARLPAGHRAGRHVLLVGAGRRAVAGAAGRIRPPLDPVEEPPSAVAWAAMAAFVLVNVGLVAEHVSNGGSPQIRYLMPSLPIVVVMVGRSRSGCRAGPASRSSSRWPSCRRCSCTRSRTRSRPGCPAGMDAGPDRTGVGERRRPRRGGARRHRPAGRGPRHRSGRPRSRRRRRPAPQPTAAPNPALGGRR